MTMTQQTNTNFGLWRLLRRQVVCGTIFLLLVLAVAVCCFAWRPAIGTVDVVFSLLPVSLSQYDDGNGHMPLCVLMQLTNVSENPIWLCGPSGSPAHVDEELVNGKWDSHFGWVSSGSDERFPGEQGMLRNGESVTLLVGPIEGDASEVRVGVPIILQESRPTKIHWVYCRPVQIKRHGTGYWPEFKSATKQEEKVLPYGVPPPLSSENDRETKKNAGSQ